MQRWQLQEAKSRMSELVRRAQRAPQAITVHGRAVAVVLSQEAFDALSQPHGTLVEFMQASPLAEADDVAFERDRGPAREIDVG